jgi:hypothetical protein
MKIKEIIGLILVAPLVLCIFSLAGVMLYFLIRDAMHMDGFAISILVFIFTMVSFIVGVKLLNQD